MGLFGTDCQTISYTDQCLVKNWQTFLETAVKSWNMKKIRCDISRFDKKLFHREIVTRIPSALNNPVQTWYYCSSWSILRHVPPLIPIFPRIKHRLTLETSWSSFSFIRDNKWREKIKNKKKVKSTLVVSSIRVKSVWPRERRRSSQPPDSPPLPLKYISLGLRVAREWSFVDT